MPLTKQTLLLWMVWGVTGMVWARDLPTAAALGDSQDLNLPDWGPYSKIYAGVSHIADPARGLRFDLSVFSAKSGGAILVPELSRVNRAGMHPWACLPDYDFWTFRQNPAGSPGLNVDISYLAWSHAARLIRIACVNHGAARQAVDLHFAASLCLPNLAEGANDRTKLRVAPFVPVLPAHALWCDAEDYESMDFVSDENGAAAGSGIARRFLQDDGLVRGEMRGDDWVSGSAVALGRHPGDFLKTTFELSHSIADGAVVFRLRTQGVEFQMQIDQDTPVKVTIPGEGKMMQYARRTKDWSGGRHALTLREFHGMADLDGFAVCAHADAEKVAFKRMEWNPKPAISAGSDGDSLALKYAALPSSYGLRWFFPRHELHSFSGRDLGGLFRGATEEAGVDHYTVVTLPKLDVAAGSTQVVYAVVATGSDAALRQILGAKPDFSSWEQLYQKRATEAASSSAWLDDGKKYQLSGDILSANLLGNLAYPMSRNHRYVRALTPGKCWDNFYTWDAGMIGIGLNEVSLPLSVEHLNMYLYPQGSSSAFLHHGSPVPTQIYQFQELWNRTQSRELLAYFYPRLKYYYAFMCGDLDGSTLRRLPSNLLQPWDYFYNSGGWDDYPPQLYVHAKHLERFCSPVITTAQVIRMAKILRQAATELGIDADVSGYDRQIKMFTEALQENAWDAASGYFGYVMHDVAGKPTGILRSPAGENFDMGLDGASPLLSGICGEEQQQRLLEHLRTPGQIWSAVGLSTVDQRASYYQTNGYWNGSVWIPYQWMMWKTMLDLGDGDFADQIASTAMDAWKRNVETTGNSFEFCHIATGRADGWPQFSGLSSPVLNWHAAYFRPGTVTAGFDVWLTKKTFGPENSALDLRFRLPGVAAERTSCILVCLNPSRSYAVTLNGQPISARILRQGSLSIKVPWNAVENHLSINPQ